MEQGLKILLLEDSYTDAEIIKRLVKKAKPNCDFLLAMNKNDFLKALDEFSPDAILSDNSLPQFDATEALQIVRNRSIQVPFILVTGTVSEEFAAGIMKQGADDYILKDRMQRLTAAIDTALQKQKTEALVRNGEEIRKLIMKSALDAIICIDITGAITVWNLQAEKMFGWKEEEVIGKKISETIIPEQYRKRHTEGFNHYLETGEGPVLNKVIEITALNRIGIEFPVELAIVPIKQEGNDFFCAFIRDITERKKAEEKIHKSKEQYRDLVENITDLICTHDLDGRILSVNTAAEELIGHKFNPEENLNIKDILAPDRKADFNLYITAIKTMGRVHGLMKVKTFAGDTHIWEYNNSLKTTGGDTPVVRGYARDITESRKAEETLRRNEARLNEAQAMSQTGSWEIDLAQNSHAWSDEFYRIYGLNKGEVEPSEDLFLSFIHPEDAAFARKKVQDAFDTLKDSSFDFRFIRKDGMIRQGCTEWRFEFDKKEILCGFLELYRI